MWASASLRFKKKTEYLDKSSKTGLSHVTIQDKNNALRAADESKRAATRVERQVWTYYD